MEDEKRDGVIVCFAPISTLNSCSAFQTRNEIRDEMKMHLNPPDMPRSSYFVLGSVLQREDGSGYRSCVCDLM